MEAKLDRSTWLQLATDDILSRNGKSGQPLICLDGKNYPMEMATTMVLMGENKERLGGWVKEDETI